MNFWNNPKYTFVKVLVVLVVVAGAGFFVFKSMHMDATGNQGRVIDTSMQSTASADKNKKTTVTKNGDFCTISNGPEGDSVTGMNYGDGGCCTIKYCYNWSNGSIIGPGTGTRPTGAMDMKKAPAGIQ